MSFSTQYPGRIYSEYGTSMDGALSAKVKDIEPQLLPGLIVDRGCGTGSLMSHLSTKGHKVVGIELSDEFCANKVGVIQADLLTQVFRTNFVDNIVLSSVLHEVYSYNGYSMDAVKKCLSVCAQELRPGGRLIVRDIWAPEAEDVLDYHLSVSPGVLDIFQRFVSEYPQSFNYRIEEDNSCPTRPTTSVHLPTHIAVEFLSKKQYQKHWDLEVKEVYTSVPISVFWNYAQELGLKVVHSEPTLNQWVVDNHWKKGVGGVMPTYTNQLVVMEKLTNEAN